MNESLIKEAQAEMESAQRKNKIAKMANIMAEIAQHEVRVEQLKKRLAEYDALPLIEFS